MGSQPSRPRRPRAPRGAPPAARPPPPGRGPCAGPRAVGWRRWPCSAGRRPLASPRRRRAVAGRSPGGRPRSPGSPPAAGRRRLRGGGLPGLRDPRRRARAGRGRADGSRLGRRRGPHRRGRRDHRREGPARRPRRLRLLRPRHRAGREAGRPGGGPLVLDPPSFDLPPTAVGRPGRAGGGRATPTAPTARGRVTQSSSRAVPVPCRRIRAALPPSPPSRPFSRANGGWNVAGTRRNRRRPRHHRPRRPGVGGRRSGVGRPAVVARGSGCSRLAGPDARGHPFTAGTRTDGMLSGDRGRRFVPDAPSGATSPAVDGGGAYARPRPTSSIRPPTGTSCRPPTASRR